MRGRARESERETEREREGECDIHVCTCGHIWQRLKDRIGGLATNPPCDKLFKVCSTVRRGPRQLFVTEGPRPRFVTEGRDCAKALFYMRI